MIKIKLSTEVLEKHKKYFEKNIKSELIERDIDYISKNVIEYKNYCSLCIQKVHNKFMKFCNENWEVIATGKPNELRQLNERIKYQYPEIIELINAKCDNNDKTENESESEENDKSNKGKKHSYRDFLMKLFGYENFVKRSFIDILINKVKDYKGKKSYDHEVRDLVIDNLGKIYPDLSLDFIDELKNQKTREDFEKIFRNQINNQKNKIDDITIDNYNVKNFLGEWNPYSFVIMSELMVCPYCNRQYITPIFSPTGGMRADLDHFLPKSIYPYFSMSLYNLVPACKFCNSSFKGRKEFEINDVNPYEQNFDDYIKFRIDRQSKKPFDIKIDKIKDEGIDNYLEIFKIKTQYSYHSSQVRELIQKRLAYSEEYINDIFESNPNYFVSKDEIKELIIGFNKNKLKINDNPLAKLKKDIVEELKFFDDINNIEELISKKDIKEIDINLLNYLEKLLEK